MRKLRILFAMILVLITVVSTSPITQALPAAQRQLFYGKILVFDEGDGDGSGGACSTLEGDTVQAQIFNYLIGKMVHGQPLQDFHVAGIMGNMWAESGYQPQRLQGTPSGTITLADAAEGSSLGWGLVQWTPAGKFITAAKAAGKDPNDLQVQLDFLLEQLNGGTPAQEAEAGQLLIGTTDVGSATVTFETKYERHRGPPQPARVVEAQRILDELAGSAAGSTGGGGCGSGDLSETTLGYAWPEYHPAPYTQKKPEYEEAITTAMAEGQYVGLRSNPGVDCGAFVTRLLIDSGWEPNYNFAGKTADGAGNVSSGQIRWARENWDLISVTSTSDLKPGDVAFNSGLTHSFVFVGTVPGFETQVASASLNERAPMAGRENPLGSELEWYRKR